MLKIVRKYVEEITKLLSEGVSGGDRGRREMSGIPEPTGSLMLIQLQEHTKT